MNKKLLKSNQQKTYEFMGRYDFTNSLLGKNSPKKYKSLRILLFVIYVVLALAAIISSIYESKTLSIILGIAAVIDAILMGFYLRRTNLSIESLYHSMTFKKWIEIDQFVEKNLGLNKEERKDLAQISLNCSNRHKKNYYQWGIALGIVSILVAILISIKDVSIFDLFDLLFLLASITFGLFILIGNIANSIDQKSIKYFEIYSILSDLDSNKEYKKLKEIHLQIPENDLEVQPNTSESMAVN